jgi:hypothetical protein
MFLGRSPFFFFVRSFILLARPLIAEGTLEYFPAQRALIAFTHDILLE